MLKADQRSRVSLSLRPGPSASASSTQGGSSADIGLETALKEPFVFYWTCTKRAGWAGLDDDVKGDFAKRSADGSAKRDGCGFFRVLDLRKEGRDCGVSRAKPSTRPAEQPADPAQR
jgi:hypothetical protein